MALTCKLCGTEIKENETVCSLCGTAVEKTSVPVVEDAPAPVEEEVKPEPAAEAESIVAAEEVKGETDAAPIWICTQCGKEFDSATKFCGECGGKVTEKKPVEEIVPVWICSKCGKEFDAATKFCGECGGKVTEKNPVEEIVPVWICTKCGKEFESATKFCCECGGKVEEVKPDAPEVLPTEPSETGVYDVYLQDCGSNKVGIVKEVRSVTGYDLKEAKDLVESAPACLKKGCSAKEAEAIEKQLNACGASVEIVESREKADNKPVPQVVDTKTQTQQLAHDNITMTAKRAKEIFHNNITPVLGDGRMVKIKEEKDDIIKVSIAPGGDALTTSIWVDSFFQLIQENGTFNFVKGGNKTKLHIKTILKPLINPASLLTEGLSASGDKDRAEACYYIFEELTNSMLAAPEEYFCTESAAEANNKSAQELLNTFFPKTTNLCANLPFFEYPGKLARTEEFIKKNFPEEVSLDEVILFWDAGTLVSGRSGILLTTKGIYYAKGMLAVASYLFLTPYNAFSKRFVPYNEVKDIGLNLLSSFAKNSRMMSAPIIVTEKGEGLAYIPVETKEINDRIASHKIYIKELSNFIEAMKRRND